jgi:hypothetical protein
MFTYEEEKQFFAKIFHNTARYFYTKHRYIL